MPLCVHIESATLEWLRRAGSALRPEGRDMGQITDDALQRELRRLEKQRGAPFAARRKALPRGPAPKGGG